jgi:hypothetical protein
MTQSINLLPTLTVGTTAVQVDQRGLTFRQFRSISLQADAANTGIIYVGDSTVTALKYARALAASDWMTITGDSVDGAAIWVVASVAAQVLHPSGT